MAEQIAEGLYRLDIPLPGNPLKNLNSYLLTGERNLLIDTGFRLDACREAMEHQLRELGVEEYGIDWMTDNCINVFAGSMRNHTKALTRDEVKQIYLEAF